MLNTRLLRRWCTSPIIPWTRTFSSSPRSCALQAQKVVTFDRSKMEEMNQKIANISSMVHVTWSLGSKLRPRFSRQLRYGINYHPGEFMTSKIPFPPDTRGLFYYFRDITMPPISGGIRFRVCDDLAGFDAGHDLLTDIKEPWAIPLIRIAREKVWYVALGHLVRDGQVDEALVRDIKTLHMPMKSVKYRSLFMPTQPFVFNLQNRLLALGLVTRKSSSRVDFQHLFYDSRLKPVKGCVKLRFEMLKPEPEAGPTIGLRILDLLTPITYPEIGRDEYTELKVGELLQRPGKKNNTEPWCYPLKLRGNGEEWLKFIRTSRVW